MNLKTLLGLCGVAGSILSVRSYNDKIDTAKANGEFDKECELIVKAVDDWTKYLKNKFDFKVEVINPENLPEKGPVLYVSNHQSYADIFALLDAVPHQIGFIAKDEFSNTPLLAAWIKRLRGLFINRGDARESLKTINEGAEYLKQGFSLVIFPEGTRSHSSEMTDFKPGSLKLATKAKVPVVPVTLDGGYKAFEIDGNIHKGVNIKVMFHPAIETENLSRQELAELPQKVEDQIRDGLKKILEGENK